MLPALRPGTAYHRGQHPGGGTAFRREPGNDHQRCGNHRRPAVLLAGIHHPAKQPAFHHCIPGCRWGLFPAVQQSLRQRAAGAAQPVCHTGGGIYRQPGTGCLPAGDQGPAGAAQCARYHSGAGEFLPRAGGLPGCQTDRRAADGGVSGKDYLHRKRLLDPAGAGRRRLYVISREPGYRIPGAAQRHEMPRKAAEGRLSRLKGGGAAPGKPALSCREAFDAGVTKCNKSAALGKNGCFGGGMAMG